MIFEKNYNSIISHGSYYNMTEFIHAKLYYPNQWNKNIRSLSEDLEFNWFLCSQKYRDPRNGMYVIKLAAGSRFYDDTTGINYIISDKNNPPVLLLDTTDSKNSVNKKLIEKYNYQGIARCDKTKRSIDSPICLGVIFIFKRDALKEDNFKNECPLITYSKINYKCIKKKIPNFPTAKDIDFSISNGYSMKVCRVLYEYLEKYWV